MNRVLGTEMAAHHGGSPALRPVQNSTQCKKKVSLSPQFKQELINGHAVVICQAKQGEPYFEFLSWVGLGGNVLPELLLALTAVSPQMPGMGEMLTDLPRLNE